MKTKTKDLIQAAKLPKKWGLSDGVASRTQMKPITKIQLGDHLWDQLRNQLRNQLFNQLRDQLRNQLSNQLLNQLLDRLANQIWIKVTPRR